MSKYVTAGMFVVLAMALSAEAHDYWLQPQRFFLSKGDTTGVQMFVGDHFAGEVERSFRSKKTLDFRLVSPAESSDLITTVKDDKKTVATIAPKRVGGHLVVLERDWSHIEIEAAKFNQYLEHEGLSHIVELRRGAGEDKTVGRERYRRYLKALVQVGDAADDAFKQRIGHRLEILPQANPSTSKTGEPISVSVLFGGQPLRGAQVAAYNRYGDDTKTQEVRTDDEGRVQFKFDRPGLWLIRLVHMQRCENVPGYDWESHWAAYSFQRK